MILRVALFLSLCQGMDAFLVIPLLLGQRDLGALMVMSQDAAALDQNTQKLCQELALQLAQVLYTKICADEVRALLQLR